MIMWRFQNMSEFNLSSKRQDTNKDTDFIRYAYTEEDVKEFIRLLKEAIWDTTHPSEFSEKIDELAGDNLI